MDQYEYMAQTQERQDGTRNALGLAAIVALVVGLLLIGLSSIKTDTKKTGIIGFRKESVVPVPTEERLALLLIGMLLMLIAFALAVVCYRIWRTHLVLAEGGPVWVGPNAPHGAPHVSSDAQYPASGRSKEFWVQTVIGILGLLITALSAGIAWWAG